MLQQTETDTETPAKPPVFNDLDPIGGCVPKRVTGLYYLDFLQALSEAMAPELYLEIGTRDGASMSRVTAKNAIAIDPNFVLRHNVAARTGRLSLISATSDDFFASGAFEDIHAGPVNLAFIDGMHLFEFVIRDFHNVEAKAARDSIILLHDVLPLSVNMAGRSFDDAVNAGRGTFYGAAWTGDVYKAVLLLKKYRPDLHIDLIDAAHTGLAMITNLDPKNTVLRDRYDAIIAEEAEKPINRENILSYYESISIREAAALGREQFPNELHKVVQEDLIRRKDQEIAGLKREVARLTALTGSA